MVLSYTMSIILVSLAIYGVWCVIKDVWFWFLEPKLMRKPSTSFLLTVKDLEDDIEYILRYLIDEIEANDRDTDIIIVDVGSTDLTAPIIERLIYDTEVFIRLISTIDSEAHPEASKWLPLCHGEVIYYLDLVNRIKRESALAIIATLLVKDSREVYINGH